MTTAVVDTSVLIADDRDDGAPGLAGVERLTTTTVTMAELIAGPITAKTEVERARRQKRLQEVRDRFPTPLPFDVRGQDAFGVIFALNRMAGRDHRRRYADLLIASIALAHGYAVVTMNAQDFAPFNEDLEVIGLGSAG